MTAGRFPVVELRRYAIREGQAHAFARCFESFFPEAFQQVDPIDEPAGARGVVVAQVFTVTGGTLATFAREAEAGFARYREAGLRELGVLVTLDVPNNFPRHPVRMDGPHLVWLGLGEDDGMIEARFRPLAEHLLPRLTATGLLRCPPEEIILDPAPRSRLRWLGPGA